MKFRWIATVVILALALGSGCLAYICLRKPMPAVTTGEDASLLWLRYEFKLPSDKMARIEKMHAAYQVVCDEHCRLVREARDEIKKLRAAPAEHCDIVATETKLAELDRNCVTSLEAHLREIAAVMGGDDGQRYLSVVLPRIAHFDHQGAPKLDLDPNAGSHDHHAHH